MIVTIFLLITVSTVILYALKLILNSDRLGFILGIIGLICGIFIIKPDWAQIIANYLGVGKATDLLLFMSFIIGIFISLTIHIKIKKMHQLITKLARHIALQDVNKN